MGGFFSNLVDSLLSSTRFKADRLPPTSSKGSPLYDTVPENWYQSKPYAFKAKREGKDYIFYLPINPRNISIVTHFGTNIVSTLYGTVEEHSEQRYFDITISGTTGFAPRYLKEEEFERTKSESAVGSSGRKRYEDFSVSVFVFGLMGKTMGKVQNVLSQANTAINSVGNENFHKSGISNNSSGYVAFHNFYKFLLTYKKSAATGFDATEPPKETMDPDSSNAPLVFVNYKDNNQYSCAIQRFVLERTAEDPMLYNYSIQMRAYDLRPIKTGQSPTLRDRYADLGLDSKQSIAAKAKVAVNAGKSALSSAEGAVKTLGA